MKAGWGAFERHYSQLIDIRNTSNSVISIKPTARPKTRGSAICRQRLSAFSSFIVLKIMTEFRVESRIEDEDYLQGLAALRKAW